MKRVAVEEGVGPLFGEELLERLLVDEGRGEGEAAPGQSLGETEQVGLDPGSLARKGRPRPAEARHHLVGDQRNPGRVAGRAHVPQEPAAVHAHPGRALDQGFDDHPGGPASQLVQGPADCALGHGDAHGVEQHRREGREEGVRVADRHRAEGVAVVAALEGDEGPTLVLTATHPELPGDLQRHLHRGRAVVGEEHPRQVAGRAPNEFLGQADGGFVGRPREQDVVEAFRLVGQGLHDAGVSVPVQGRPPGRDAVDQDPPVRQGQGRALGARDRQGVLFGLVLGVGVPEMGSIPRDERVGRRDGVGHPSVGRRARPRRCGQPQRSPSANRMVRRLASFRSIQPSRADGSQVSRTGRVRTCGNPGRDRVRVFEGWGVPESTRARGTT